jgi:hypothetical protein
MHMTATLTKWYEDHGRHQIYAGGKKVDLSSNSHSLLLNKEAVEKGRQTDLDAAGIAKNAREEKLRARDQQKKQAEDERMMKLYRQHVLKEPAPTESPVMQIQGLKSKKNDEPVTTH